MIYTRILSGLGNQLFQWAAARALADGNSTGVKLDLSFFQKESFSYHEQFPRPFKLNQFRLQAEPAGNEELRFMVNGKTPNLRMRWSNSILRLFKRQPKIQYVQEPSLDFHPDVLKLGDNVYLDGYWASEKYFKSSERVIRAELQFKNSKLHEDAAKSLNQFRKVGVPLVGMQVRRGDVYYVSEVLKKPETLPMPLLKRDYFVRAMAQFSGRVQFVVFSDSDKDIELCRKEFSDFENIRYVSGNDDITDFAMLQHCDHQIISNSTFGWWAAWLNTNEVKTVIAPKQWYTPGSPADHNLDDMIPSGWTLV